MNLRPRWVLAAGLTLTLIAGSAIAADNPVAVQLAQRLRALQSNPQYSELAAFERLQAQQAIADIEEVRRSQRERAQYVAERRVEIAETVARTQAAQRDLAQLDRTRSELLVEASRREAERARQEADRLRLQAQIQAEETERLRLAAEAETLARQDAEQALTSVAGQQTARVSAARQKEARLAREEAELVSGTKLPASKFEARGEVFTLPASSYASGSPKLSDSGQASLSALAAYLQASPKAKARIEGYGDKQTTGQRRADGLRDALVSAGVPKARLQSVGKGSGSAGKAVEIIVTQ